MLTLPDFIKILLKQEELKNRYKEFLLLPDKFNLFFSKKCYTKYKVVILTDYSPLGRG